VKDIFDTEEKVKSHFSKHNLFVFKAKNANAKNAQDNSRWFIRFDDSHAQFTLEFMKNLAKATEELRQKSKKQDVFV
jgi:putative salt-induced outer membrane protein YdiY